MSQVIVLNIFKKMLPSTAVVQRGLCLIIINLFWLHKFTMVRMPKRKKNIVINYIYIIKPDRIKGKRTVGTRFNFME